MTCVLVIDDDIYSSKPLRDYFELVEEWEVVLATSPSEALATLERRLDAIDAIILDIMMPPDTAVDERRSQMGQATGILLLEAIGDATKGRIPIVVLSARQDLRSLEEEKKVSRYLQKPQTATEMVEVIQELIGLSGTPTE